MPKRRRSKRPKEPNSPRDSADLFIPIPLQAALIPLLLDRVAITGFRTCALTHAIYGRPRDTDTVGTVFGRGLLKTIEDAKARHDLLILKRLHVVVESVADVGLYTGATSPIADLLHGYDIVSLCPRNEASFLAVCSSATCDILSIDYASVQPMFACRPAALHQAKARGLPLEIPYAPALLRSRSRRALLSVCRDLHRAGVRQILVSSGSRNLAGSDDDLDDVGARALRLPGDVANLVHTIMGFSGRVAARSIQGLSNPDATNKRACWRIRQLSDADNVDAKQEETTASEASKAAVFSVGKFEKEEDESTPEDDGFIAL